VSTLTGDYIIKNTDKIKILKELIQKSHDEINSIYRNCPHSFVKTGERIGVAPTEYTYQNDKIVGISLSCERFKYIKLQCQECGYEKEEKGEAVDTYITNI
jgi:hypothetical protein